MNVNDFLGKRLLLNIGYKHYPVNISEYRVLEVSPSGAWVKLMNMNGNKFWKAVAEISFIEELREFKVPQNLKDENS